MLIANILGFSIFVFLLWRSLKDDYIPEKIFNLAACVAIGLFAGLLVSKWFVPGYWFWLEFGGITIFYVIAIKKLKIKFFESLEGMVSGLLPWVGLTYLSIAISRSSLASFLAFWVCLISFFLYYFINSRYRTFSWYKSGKIGISSTLTLFLVFLIRGVVSVFYPTAISFVGKYEIYFSGVVMLVILLLILKLIKGEE